MKTQLDAEKKRPSNTNDALIADTCLQNGFLLITNDQALTKVATVNGCAVRDLRTKP
ncbi:PIN domain-containing protein [Mesorhizobium sp. M9A.F.Ca.ET.002.03.1.2]|uniref:PIN domain-containing protein n=1 Tax=Mesorhizobium sp. M9A.F.Ca.ET.002.03.1.2 TaxID=2493668 RepID=UPI000F75D319|nr:PIN domain-containing protein [Mesorhizobium sp. M9A.F.Ca.ET.002.03.1.2]AZO00116.1 PIN domain-containing protein [Mesorhizobium sp. M9A.F.Ca.ET.002.03.1.2]